MKMTLRPASLPRIAWPLTALTLVGIILGALLFRPGLYTVAFAQSRDFQTCRTNPSPRLCTGSDPIVATCAFDATTSGPLQQIVSRQGLAVGEIQLRYSSACHSYWGRAFSFIAGTSILLYIPQLGIGSNATYLSQSTAAYSNMVYATPPDIEVTIVLSGGQSIASATLNPNAYPLPPQSQ